MAARKTDRTRIEVMDTTLRDGTQSEGVSLSMQDKLLIVEALDSLGELAHRVEVPGGLGLAERFAQLHDLHQKLRVRRRPPLLDALAVVDQQRLGSTQIVA